MRTKRTVLMLALALCSWGGMTAARAQDVQGLVQETMKFDRDNNLFRLVWWIPTEYWELSFKGATNMTEAQKQEFYKIVTNYVVVAVIDAKTTMLGSLNSISRDAIMAKISLAAGASEPLKPLADTEISGDAKNLFSMMKPMLSSLMGQLGSSMEFVFFKGVDDRGVRLIDPARPGLVAINYDSSKFAWRLPLGSLLPPQYDLQSGEAFPGNYIYSPFTGAKLTAKPAAMPAPADAAKPGNAAKPADSTKPADAPKSAAGAKS